MLPEPKQFLSANFHLNAAAEQALLVHWMKDVAGGQPDYHKTDCIEQLKKAAEALGFEIIQRVAPPSPGGGRMDTPEEPGIAAVADA